MRLNQTDPNNFFDKQNVSLTDAIEAQKPAPPWKRKLEVIRKRISIVKGRRWVTIIIVPLFLIEWALAATGQLVEVIRNSFETLILALENYKNEPTGTSPTN